MKLLLSEPAAGTGEPGAVLDDAPTVACGEGAVRILRLQRGGRAAMPPDAFRRGLPGGRWPARLGMDTGGGGA